MKRRSFIASSPLLAALSGCLDDSGTGTGRDETEDGPPFDVTAVDAPGSDAGTVSVPTTGQVQLVNFSRTTCPTSRALLSHVGEAKERLQESVDVGPDGTVHVMSVIDRTSGAQPSPSELSDWWADQNGDWTIAIDESGVLFDHHEVTVTPTTIAIDGTGEVHWRDEAGTTTSNMVSGVETALEESDVSDG